MLHRRLVDLNRGRQKGLYSWILCLLGSGGVLCIRAMNVSDMIPAEGWSCLGVFEVRLYAQDELSCALLTS